MTVTKLTLSPTLLASRLAMSGVFMAAIGMSAGAQAASPYVELYQNNNVSSGNTDAAPILLILPQVYQLHVSPKLGALRRVQAAPLPRKVLITAIATII